MTTETLQAARLTHPDHASAVEDYYRRGWTDGLPVIPPEPTMVAAFPDSGGVTAGAVLGTVPTRDITVTAEDVAINAVMAGCLAEYAPVVTTAVAALLREEAIPHSVTATLASAAGDRQRPGPHADRRGMRAGVHGTGLPGERNDRAGVAAGHPQRAEVRPAPARPRHVLHPRPLFLLLR